MTPREGPPSAARSRWWAGPIHVERLAEFAVDALAAATQRLRPSPAATSAELIAASFASIDHLRVSGRPPTAWAPMSGFFAASDGWVRLHGNYPHHAQAITRATGAQTKDELVSALRERAALDIEQKITAAGGIGVAVRTPQQWAAHPHALATAADDWMRVERRDAPPRGRGAGSTGVEGLPLVGVRVLDLTRVIAGPTCSQVLACLGADVLRIDPPGRPELLDQYLSNGMGKRSVAADLVDPATLSRVERLLSEADVVLLCYRPGSLARFGLDPDDLRGRHPHLIIGSLSAWGEHGPWADRPGFDSIVQAACGIAVLTGDDERPGTLPVQALDHASGHLLAAGVMGLLADAAAGTVRVSLLGAARALLAYPPPPQESPGELTIPRVEVSSPHGHLLAVPPPLTLDGATLERPVGGYGAASLQWAPEWHQSF